MRHLIAPIAQNIISNIKTDKTLSAMPCHGDKNFKGNHVKNTAIIYGGDCRAGA
jgi:hypothetical protein